MTLRVYNTLKGEKQDFVPIDPKKVSMYVCGPTVYDTSHIGHARSVVVFDMIYRWLMHHEYKVCYVRNFTDVDDKIINKANETGEDCFAITEKYINEFHDEMDALNVLRPTIEPKATEHIRQIVDFIKRLIDKGNAYPVEGGDVYFSIDSFKQYGRLSGRKVEDMKAGARIAVDDKKKNPMDFTLWKPAKPGEPSWESPWGKGRPGWHIECSAMSHEYLGQSIDIHGGGKDLIFPHHENEIAQSEALFEQPFVKYWIHNGFVDINNEKMSKSLGNFTMIKEVLAVYSPEVIRMFLLSKHYRSPIDYNEDTMKEMSAGLDRIYTFLERVGDSGIEPAGTGMEQGPVWHSFAKAMDDDFNSARGIAAVFEAVKQGNRLLDNPLTKESRKILSGMVQDINAISGILGIFLLTPTDHFAGKKEKSLAGRDIDSQAVAALILERKKAREAKDFAAADVIRDRLKAMNIVLEDGPDGTTWKFE